MVTSAPGEPPDDVRMRGFRRRATVEQALAWVDAHAQPLGPQRVSLWRAVGRTLAADAVSAVPVPPFARSMMDGYALVAEETHGASAYHRLALQIVGQSLPGRPFSGPLARGQAVRIMTGAPLPAGADAVLPAEQAEQEGQRLWVLDAVPPGKNVATVGEDVAAGARVLGAGRILRPQDVGLLSSIGVAEVAVIRQPQVRIVITGDELLPAGTPAAGAKIADANGPMLAALVARDGGRACWGSAAVCDERTSAEPAADGALPPAGYLVPDDPAAILAALQAEADVVLVSGGSSVGQEDHAPLLVAQQGELAIHGIAMRPSSPAGMGRLGGKLVFLLPGNPVSCLCAYDFYAGRAIRRLAGRSPDWPYLCRRLPLGRKLVSQVGRVDYARVRVAGGVVEPLATSGASILSSTTAAEGFVVVPGDSEGFPAGAMVDVFFYDQPSERPE